ncbi:hypothetical protein LCGC14_1970660 [marine sediment metagenome]|uniref:Uncharacterized protein n=1 Tax=marine sediment metagenome TaxID=412755 RepID=A0A0F9FBZ8_9ZZZZ
MNYTYDYGEEMPMAYSSSTTTGSSPYFENYFVGVDTAKETDSSGFISYAVSSSDTGDWQWVKVGGDWKDAFNNNETLQFYRLMEDYTSNGVEWKGPTPFSWFDILDIED